ncbi:MAG: hypothetical protein QCI00_00060 [Candidatus Thermoplasmatota archaeon]|nr:hypothetical protein [Candidatus Thermoplasmatota archaeon]
MRFEEVSALLPRLSLQEILFGDTSEIASVIYFIVMISIYALSIWHFYRFLARRDCFSHHTERHPRLSNMLKYMFFFPFVAFLFFIGFSLLLLFITKDYDIPILLSTAFAMVAAIRIVAYYSEDLSRDLAKMLPFALLGLFIVDPQYFSFEDIISKMSSIPIFFTLCIKYILYIVFMEWILRVLLNIRYSIHSTARYISTSEPHSSNISINEPVR